MKELSGNEKLEEVKIDDMNEKEIGEEIQKEAARENLLRKLRKGKMPGHEDKYDRFSWQNASSSEPSSIKN